MAKIPLKQIDMQGAGFTDAIWGQLIQLAQDQMISLVDIDNSENNGVVVIDNPEAGTIYRCIYPTSSINVGPMDPGVSIWIEFVSGVSLDNAVGNNLSGFQFSAEQTIYWAYALGLDNDELFTRGHMYQIKLRNVFGRIYGDIVGTQLLAPTPIETEEEEE